MLEWSRVYRAIALLNQDWKTIRYVNEPSIKRSGMLTARCLKDKELRVNLFSS